MQLAWSLTEISLWDYEKHSCRRPRNVDEIHRCTQCGLTLRSRVWGKIERNSFTDLPDKRSHSGLCPQNCVSHLRGDIMSLPVVVQEARLLVRVWVCAGLHSSHPWITSRCSGLASGSLVMLSLILEVIRLWPSLWNKYQVPWHG